MRRKGNEFKMWGGAGFYFLISLMHFCVVEFRNCINLVELISKVANRVKLNRKKKVFQIQNFNRLERIYKTKRKGKWH